MMDRDLAALYGVTTGALNQAVARNLERFPGDFMFRLDRRELTKWISQFVISDSSFKMGTRRRPYVFTENGVAMLSSVLKSRRAIKVNRPLPLPLWERDGVRGKIPSGGRLPKDLSDGAFASPDPS